VSDTCRWLHQQLEPLPVVHFPFDLGRLPTNGIYAFYEAGETGRHGSDKPRIVRIGTHREGNFRSRIGEHFLLDDARKMQLDATKPAPHDRSIFRKNLGRALLNRAGDPYLEIWNLDFTTRKNRDDHGQRRDIAKEKQIETEVTRILRETFSFRFIAMEGQAARMGSTGLESAFIGTVARCHECGPSPGWLGRYSPIARIRASGLWLVQHVDADEISDPDRKTIATAIAGTTAWLAEDGNPR
jgi:hypothetical protein